MKCFLTNTHTHKNIWHKENSHPSLKCGSHSTNVAIIRNADIETSSFRPSPEIDALKLILPIIF